MKSLLGAGQTLGCDPELFFTQNGKVIGSELVIPELLTYTGTTYGKSDVVRDGVQVELHPSPFACRANLSDSLAQCFKILKGHLASKKDVGLNFDPVVKITKDELMKLSEKSRILGCQPSLNIYGFAPIVDDGMVQTRVAGGHFHIGTQMISKGPFTEKFIRPERLVRLLDICVGVPCVLLDRHPKAAERRQQYGRAGEYRLPPHGLEYRTLSNFWLRAYPLFSLVTSMIHEACNIAYTSSDYARDVYGKDRYYRDTYAFDAEDEILSNVSAGDVQKAINENDLETAQSIWEKAVKPVYKQINFGGLGISAQNITAFEYFAKKGLDHWWPTDKHNPFEHWANKPDGHGNGWESFIGRTIVPEMATPVAQAGGLS